jgi:hypothetical protein
VAQDLTAFVNEAPLQEKISDRYLDEGDARRLAEKILHDNARDFFE